MILNLHGKETPFVIWKTLKDLFHRSSDARKLALRDKLRSIQTQKNEIIPDSLRFEMILEELEKIFPL